MSIIKKYSAVYGLIVMVVLLISCDKWPDQDVKTITNDLEGNWKLERVRAIDRIGGKDSIWRFEQGFINFERAKSHNPTSVSYSLTRGDTVKSSYIVTVGESTVLFNDLEGVHLSKMAMRHLFKIEELSSSRLELQGTGTSSPDKRSWELYVYFTK